MGYLDEEDDYYGGGLYGGYGGGSWWRKKEWGTRSNAEESLRKIAHTLSAQHDVKIRLLPYEKHVAHSNNKENTITVGTQDLWLYGTDYYVALIMHEVAHIKNTPYYEDKVMAPIRDFRNPEVAKNVHNMIEDKRIDEMMLDRYPGASIYYDVLHGETLGKIAQSFSTPPPHSYRDIEEFIRFTVDDIYRKKSEAGQVNEENKQQVIADIEQKARTWLLYRTLALSEVESEGYLEFGMTTGVEECDEIATQVTQYTRKYKDPTRTADEVVETTIQLVNGPLEPLIPNPPPGGGGGDGDGQGDGDGEHEHGQGGCMARRGVLDQMTEKKPGGRGMDKEIWDREPVINDVYTDADREAQPLVDRMRRKLIAVLRENQHQRYAPQKRKGLVDKKSIVRVARDNYRIYKKREDKKGVEHTVAVLIDVSGSMSGNLEFQAFKASSIFARVFRSLGFPTAIYIFSTLTKSVLEFRDRYVAKAVNDRIEMSSGEYYGGGTDLDLALDVSIKRLERVGAGKSKLLIVLTDGAVDRGPCAERIRQWDARKDCNVVIFYIKTPSVGILSDPSKEVAITDVNEQLVPEAAKLLQKVMGPMQE